MSLKNEHPVRDMIFSDLGKIAKLLGAVAGSVGAAMIESADKPNVTPSIKEKDIPHGPGYYEGGRWYYDGDDY